MHILLQCRILELLIPCLSAHAIVNEIEALIEQFGADGLNFREDNFMVNRKRVKDICHEMLKRK